MRTIFRGATIHDGTPAAPRLADLAVRDGVIEELGPALHGDHVVELEGRSIVPGLIDCHVHVALPTIDALRLVNTPLSYRLLEAVRSLGRLLDAGFTTVRDAAGADVGLKRAVEDGLARGPRLEISIGMISTTGGHGDPWLLSGVTLPWLFPVYPGVPDTCADGPDEMRRVVRELVRAGADVIKVATSGGVMSPRDDPRDCRLRDDELAALVTEARAARLPVMAHAHAAEAIKASVRAGVRSIEHGIFLDDEAIELMVERGTFLVPTLIAPRSVVAASDAGQPVDPASVEQARALIERHEDSFRRARDAGVRIAMGSDSGLMPHGENLAELEAMAGAGMPPDECLRSATSHAAELLGLDDRLGSLEPGKVADFVVVEGDPLDFARLRERIRDVYRDGVRVGGAVGSSTGEAAHG